MGCSKPDFENAGIKLADDSPELVVNLSNIMLLSVEQRLEQYSKSGRSRLLAYNRLTELYVPGFQGEKAKALIENLGVELAPGMGDQIFSETHRELQAYFLNYAARYNQSLVEQLSSAQP